MKIIETKLPGVKLIEPAVFGDHRGFFMESYNEEVANMRMVSTCFHPRQPFSICRSRSFARYALSTESQSPN